MKKPGKATIIVAAVVIIFVVLIIIQNTVGFGKKANANQQRPAATKEAVNVEVKKMVPENFTKTANINGELAYDSLVANVTTDVAGRVVEIPVARGQKVEKGETIMVVDPSTPGSSYLPRNIVANVSGTVLTVDAYVGKTVTNGAALATIGDTADLKLNLNIPEKYLATITEGTTAQFTTAAWPDDVYTAVVSYVGKSVDTATRTVPVELKITNADDRLMSGMFVKTNIVTYRAENVYVVPTTCLSSYLGHYTVYVVNGNKAVRTVVTTGASNDSYTVITSGLKDGDRVIVAGSATEGALVNVIN